MATDSRNQKFEKIPRLEHELSEATSSLKSALEAVSINKRRAVKAEAKLELSNTHYVELTTREEAGRKRMGDLEKAMDALKLENSDLAIKKASLEDELFTQEKNIVIMLGETFKQVSVGYTFSGFILNRLYVVRCREVYQLGFSSLTDP
ncbi:hypothetical protein VNO80_01248 [Phaseolus coccineus]|uniref:Uncharacterized protein n=1 Tax=Phaseolus coccineus TaxID=3886 RepID=A0AAN9RSJ1_PHACN